MFNYILVSELRLTIITKANVNSNLTIDFVWEPFFKDIIWLKWNYTGLEGSLSLKWDVITRKTVYPNPETHIKRWKSCKD